MANVDLYFDQAKATAWKREVDYETSQIDFLLNQVTAEIAENPYADDDIMIAWDDAGQKLNDAWQDLTKQFKKVSEDIDNAFKNVEKFVDNAVEKVKSTLGQITN